MHEISVQGEIKALGWREGSSGIFTGSIEGLYEGYRIGSLKPDEKADLWVNGERSTGLYHRASGTLQFTLELTPPNFARGPYTGTISLVEEVSAS